MALFPSAFGRLRDRLRASIVGAGGSAGTTPSTVRANSHVVRANQDGFRQPLIDLQARLAALGG